MNFRKYLFLDRDGTLIEEPFDFQIDSFEKFKLLPDVISSLLALQSAGYILVMVSNQDGLGSDAYPQSKFEMIQALLMQILESQGVRFEAIRICPHFEKDRCFCRKPNIGLVKDYLTLPEMDRDRSFVIGDRLTDIALSENMGIRGIQITSERGWKEITQILLASPRKSSTSRKTKETQITAEVNLDQTSGTLVSTGIGFFDHMLEQLAYHGGFSTRITVQGDLHIDDHHTVEDTALALGTSIRKALGDKVGISRYGFCLPMDESLAQVALDLSGRSTFRFEGKFNRDTVGELSTEMIPHFFKSFSESLGATLHLKLDGENTHHQVEAAFKAVGRSLRAAIQRSGCDSLPSTKGVL